jgi:uncharacterized membrane protein YfhO
VSYSEELNSVRVEVNASTPSILVLSQTHYPGWKVRIDGTSVPLLRPDYTLTGVATPAGRHDVEFRFRPATFLAGAFVSAAALLAAIIAYRRG